jgi:hypothetical protein
MMLERKLTIFVGIEFEFGCFLFCRKNSEAFYGETRKDNIDISDVDASADLFGKYRRIFLKFLFYSSLVF